jgi:hypothetical protein
VSSPRATLAAVGVAALLGTAYWGWTQKIKPARDKAAEDAKKPFAGLNAAATREVLLRKGTEEVLLRKVDGAWRLIKPVQAPADTAVLEALVQALGDLTREETVAEADADLRQYGLDAPSGAVTFVPATEGAKAQALFFGNDNPTGSYAYAMVDGQPQVFLSWLWVKNAILKDAAELRDKAVWRWEPAQLRELRSTQGGGFHLRREDGGAWSLRLGAQEEPARQAAIEAWLAELAGLKALRVPSEDGKGGPYGLQRGPRLTLSLADGSSLQLNAGAPVDEEGFYAQGRPGTPVYVLGAGDLMVLEKSGKDLADRLAFSLDTSQVERFEVIRPEGRLKAVKSAGAWAWEGLEAGGFNFDAFLSRLAGAELSRRLDKADKPAKPLASLFFYAASGAVLEAVEFGPKRSGGQVAFGSNKQAVFLVAENLLEGLPAPPAEPKE